MALNRDELRRELKAIDADNKAAMPRWYDALRQIVGGDGEGEGAGAGDGSMDLALARTAASLEKLAVDTYQTGIDSGLVTTMAIADAAKLFQGHHQEHLDALNGAIDNAGGTAVDEPNEAVFKALIEPAVAQAKAEGDIVQIAYDLESAAAQTYAYAGGALTVPALRSTIMTIGGIEARHAAILQIAAQGKAPADVFPGERGFYPGDNPLEGIDGAVLSA